MASIPPPSDVSLEECAKYVLDRHPDEIDLHRRGKGCTGFFLGQVVKMSGNSDLKAAHLAVRNELDKRLARH
jgi:Asp-tRNA(Asn)/Glu-tRNA(Gln) amidotransferase B subunit